MMVNDYALIVELYTILVCLFFVSCVLHVQFVSMMISCLMYVWNRWSHVFQRLHGYMNLDVKTCYSFLFPL